jgi:hypothetical protein
VNVELTDGTTVELKPCPAWCRGDHDEFPPGMPVSPVIDCFHHRGPDATVNPAWRADLRAEQPDSVTVQLESFTESLDGDPGPARIDIHLRASTGDEAWTVLTPAEARSLAASLLMLADTAQRTGG